MSVCDKCSGERENIRLGDSAWRKGMISNARCLEIFNSMAVSAKQEFFYGVCFL